jgi:hypothetical protein
MKVFITVEGDYWGDEWDVAFDPAKYRVMVTSTEDATLNVTNATITAWKP